MIFICRKEFYIEVPEIARMTDFEVEEYRTEMEGIKVRFTNDTHTIGSIIKLDF